MSGFRYWIGWLLLGVLVVVGAGAAVLGVSQSPKNAPLLQAVTNTLTARSYSEVLDQNTNQGKQTDYLVYQAPDRVGGYVQSGNRRSYIYSIGTSYYQSLTVSKNTPPNNLTFYRQDNPGGVTSVDPARNYLPYATGVKHPTQSGNTYSFSLTRRGQTGSFTYTVNGQYVSQFTFRVAGVFIRLDISDVGTSPPVALPAGAKVVGAPSSTSPG